MCLAVFLFLRHWPFLNRRSLTDPSSLGSWKNAAHQSSKFASLWLVEVQCWLKSPSFQGCFWHQSASNTTIVKIHQSNLQTSLPFLTSNPFIVIRCRLVRRYDRIGPSQEESPRRGGEGLRTAVGQATKDELLGASLGLIRLANKRYKTLPLVEFVKFVINSILGMRWHGLQMFLKEKRMIRLCNICQH